MRHNGKQSNLKDHRKSENTKRNDTERDPFTLEKIVKKQDPAGPRDTNKKQEPGEQPPSKLKENILWVIENR